MIVDAYQHVLRNTAVASDKTTKHKLDRADNTAGGWFAKYASLLSGIWGKDTAPFV